MWFFVTTIKKIKELVQQLQQEWQGIIRSTMWDFFVLWSVAVP